MIAHLLLLGPWGGLQGWGVKGLCQNSAGAGPQTTQNNLTSVRAWDPQGMENLSASTGTSFAVYGDRQQGSTKSETYGKLICGHSMNQTA